jgi:adenylate cyclase
MPDDPIPTAIPRAVPRSVRDAILYMRQAMHRRVTMAELAQATRVPERTLRRHFLAFLGRAPMDHFQAMRLDAARAALLAGDAADASVTAIATGFGFTHLGRFALDYRNRFGEPPSATLARGRSAGADASHAAPDGSGWLPWSARQRPAAAIAIMPIRTAAATMVERLLAESLADQLAAALTRAHGFSVRVARQAPAPDLPSARARYCLAGQVTRLSDRRMRIALHLRDLAAGGCQMWGDAFDGAADDPIGLRDRAIAAAIAAIRPGMEEAEIAAASRGPVRSPALRDLLRRAMPLVLAADATSARQALRLLEEAAGLDPRDAMPPALAAWCRLQLVVYHTTLDPAAERSAALDLAAQAAVLDVAGDPLVLTARSSVATWSGEPQEADALLARALAIDPGFGWAWERSAVVQLNYGRAEDAFAQYRRAVALKGPRASPVNCWSGVGYAHLAAGRVAEAVRWMRRAQAANPQATWLNKSLIPCLLDLGEYQAARAAADALRRACPDMTAERAVMAVPRPLLPVWIPRLDRLVSLGLPP